MVGTKDFSKGFYIEFIRVWKIINKENKPLNMSEIKFSFEKELKKDLFQSLLYKTLISFKNNGLAKYNNLKWNLNFKEIELYYLSEKNKLQKKLNECKIKLELNINSYAQLIKLVNK